MSSPRGIAILGSTGSIGRSTLAVIALHPERFRIAVLGAYGSWQTVVEQAVKFRPDTVVLVDSEAAAQARAALRDRGSTIRVESGADALAAAVTGAEVHIVMAAIVGAAGLLPTLAAVRAGKRVLLANKEALVMAGRLLMEEVRRARTELIPIDSEHNAIFQCMPAGYLPGEAASGVMRVILTASGGPFRCTELALLEHVTPAQACDHPKWKMGRKISVDSATLMNKGLEVIEATLLFGLPESQVGVVVHPQSLVHSLVEYAEARCSPSSVRPTCARRSPRRSPGRSGWFPVYNRSTSVRSGGWISSRRITCAFPVSNLRERRRAPAARRPRSSTQRTRWRCRRFLTGA